MTSEILILTKSTMKGGYCIAGIDTLSKQWIRLVQDKEGNPLIGAYTKYQNADGHCEALDVVRVEIAERVPLKNQAENCRITAGSMQKIRTCTVKEALNLYPPESHAHTFGNDSPSLSENEMHEYDLHYSLILVSVKNLTVNFSRHRADFDYNGTRCKDFRITDTKYSGKDSFLGGSANIGDACLVISMPKVPDRRIKSYYKFIAKILLI